MRSRRLLVLACLLVLLLACRLFIPATPGSPTPAPGAPAAPVVTPTVLPSPSLSPPPTLTPTSPLSGPLDQATRPPGLAFTVRLHPDGPLYAGDRVSFEVIAPQGAPLADSKVEIALTSDPETPLGEAAFAPYGIGGRLQATLFWTWDTTGLSPGSYLLNFSVLPVGTSWTEGVTLLPSDEIPLPEPQARWQTAESQCCEIHYVTGTAAERDLDLLVEMVDEQARDAAEKMDSTLDQPAQLTFFPRVLGHGGFAGQEIAVSYLDRNYAGGGTDIVVHHELVHLLDSRRKADFRPSILVEGLAVYLSGGHFKPEPLLQRAAALLPASPGCTSVPLTGEPSLSIPAGSEACGLDWYLPLAPLADDFYQSQHETGYLQAGALVEYMVQTYGWKAFNRFYTQIKPPQPPGEAFQNQPGTQSQVIDAALQEYLGITLLELDAGFRQALERLPLTGELVQDVQLTVAYYDAMRRYQLALDPSAHFLTAWLPDTAQMRQDSIVSDFLRHPAARENIALETMLAQADAALRSAAPDYPQAARLLLAVNLALDDLAAGKPAFPSDPLAADYLSIVTAVEEAGYQAQRISLQENTARVLAGRPSMGSAGQGTGPQLVELYLYRTSSGWSSSLDASFLDRLILLVGAILSLD